MLSKEEAKVLQAATTEVEREMEMDKFNIGDSVFVSLDRSGTMDDVSSSHK
ncbi:MAG: hypothetical protein ACI8RD_009368 [Bacillariaceae sp.]